VYDLIVNKVALIEKDRIGGTCLNADRRTQQLSCTRETASKSRETSWQECAKSSAESEELREAIAGVSLNA
jgi:hypothetical protein